MKTTLNRILALALAITAAATSMFACGKKDDSSPEAIFEAVESAFENTFRPEDSKLSRLMNTAAQGGSFELSYTLGGMPKQALGFEDELALLIKEYYNTDTFNQAEHLEITLNGESILDLLFNYTGSDLSLASKALFGDKAYGISLEGFAEDLKSSEFGENGAFALDEYTLNSLYAIGDQLKSIKPLTEAMTDLEPVITAICGICKNAVENHSEASKTAGTITVLGSEIETDDYIFTYTGADLVTMAKEALTELKDGNTVNAYLDEHAETFISIYQLDVTADEIKAAADELFEEAFTALNEADEAFLGAKFTETIKIKDGKVVGGTGNIALEDGSVTDIALVFAEGKDKLHEYSLNINVNSFDYSGEPWSDTASFEYIETAHTDSEYSAVFTANADGETASLTLTGTHDKATGKFEAGIETELEGQKLQASLLGTYKESADSLSVTVSSVSAMGITIDIGELKAVLNAKDTMPVIGDYSEIFKMSEDEITAAANSIYTTVMSLAEMLEGIEF